MVEMRVGDPIPTAGLKLHDRGRLTLQVRDQVVALLGEKPVAQVS
jgi:hypothetical protein